MKISEAAAQDNFYVKLSNSSPAIPARHSKSDDRKTGKRKALRVELKQHDSESSATDSSSSGSSPSDLKRRLQQLPPTNEFTLLVDRVSALSRRISRNIDFANLQERTKRCGIEENVEGERKEEEEQRRQSEKERIVVSVERSAKLEAKGARARRRARIRLESLQAENLAMVISQPDETAATQVTDESTDEKKSERKSCRSIDEEDLPNNEVPQFSTIDLTDFIEITSHRSTHSTSFRPTFASDMVQSENSTRSEQVEATPIDYPIYTFRSEGQGDTVNMVDSRRSAYTQYASNTVRPAVFGGYRPKGSVILKNLSSESDSETTTDTVRNPYLSTCRTASPVATLEMMSPISTPNPADGPIVLPVLTARSDRLSEDRQLYSAAKSVPDISSSAKRFRQTPGSQRSLESAEDRTQSMSSCKNSIFNTERTSQEMIQEDVQVDYMSPTVQAEERGNIGPYFNGRNAFGGDFPSNSDITNISPSVTTRSEPPRANQEKFSGLIQNSSKHQIRSLSSRHTPANEYSEEHNARRRLFWDAPQDILDQNIGNNRIDPTNAYSDCIIGQEQFTSDIEYGYHNYLDNAEATPNNSDPRMHPDNRPTECFIPCFTDKGCFSGRSAASMPTELFYGGQHFTEYPSTLSTGDRGNFSLGSMANNMDYHASTDVTDVPTLAINSQEMSYPASTGSRQFSNERPLDTNALIRALSNVSIKQERRDDRVDDNGWEGNGDRRNDSSTRRSLGTVYSNSSECQMSMAYKSTIPGMTTDRSNMQNIRDQTDEMTFIENIRSMNQSPMVPPIPEIFGYVSERLSYATSQNTDENLRTGNMINEQVDPTPSQHRSFHSGMSRLNLPSTERTDVTYRIEDVMELASDGSVPSYALPSNSSAQYNYEQDRNERLPSWISAYDPHEYSPSDHGRIKRMKIVPQPYQVNKSPSVGSAKLEHRPSQSDEEVENDMREHRRVESVEICQVPPDEEVVAENLSYPPLGINADSVYEDQTQSNSDEEIQERRADQSSNLAEKISSILNESMKKSSFSQFRSPDATKVQSETLTHYCQRLHDLTAVPIKISASSPKLNYSLNYTTDSPRLRRKSQDRFPFTISESTSVKSMQFKVMPVSDKANHHQEETKSPEMSYKLEHHPSITRLACSGFEETPIELVSCVNQIEIEPKYRLMPKMRGFVKRFLRRNRKKNSDENLGSARIIYENRKCQEDSAVESRSDENVDEDEIEEVERLSLFETPITEELDLCEHYTERTSALKQKTSLEHLPVCPESSPRRYDRDDLWVKELQDPEVETHGSSVLSSETKNTDRYSIFLARSTTKVEDTPEQTFAEDSSKIDESSRKKEKGEKSRNSDDEFYRDTGCLCFRMCPIFTTTSTMPTLKYRQSIKRKNSYSRRKRKVRSGFYDKKD